jgi:uncharacterized membrane protein
MRNIHTSEVPFEMKIEERVRQVELLISNLLRVGVMLSLILIVLGTVTTFVQHPEYLSDRTSLGHLIDPGSATPHGLSEVIAGVRRFQGEALVTAGLLFLIATPVMRVGVSIFAFIYQHDRLYTLITAMVFCLLLLSFVLGKVE